MLGWVWRVGAALVFVGLNVAVYLLPVDYAVLGDAAALGAFAVTFVASAAVLVAVPYIPVVLRIAESAANLEGIVLAAALGSVLGESVAYVVGRAASGRALQHRHAQTLARLLRSPLRAFGALLVVAAIPNPVFDVAGLIAGAVRVPFGVYFSAVFLARLLRFALLVWLGAFWA